MEIVRTGQDKLEREAEAQAALASMNKCPECKKDVKYPWYKRRVRDDVIPYDNTLFCYRHYINTCKHCNTTYASEGFIIWTRNF